MPIVAPATFSQLENPVHAGYIAVRGAVLLPTQDDDFTVREELS